MARREFSKAVKVAYRKRGEPVTLDTLFAMAIPEPNSGCWLWCGALSEGYGIMKVGGSVVRAHRLAFATAKSAISATDLICHRCDQRSCINPDHMFVGTHQDNYDDMRSKGREAKARGEQHGRVVLSDDIVRQIRLSPLSTYRLSKTLNVGKTTIRDVRTGKRWGHVQ